MDNACLIVRVYLVEGAGVRADLCRDSLTLTPSKLEERENDTAHDQKNY